MKPERPPGATIRLDGTQLAIMAALREVGGAIDAPAGDALAQLRSILSRPLDTSAIRQSLVRLHRAGFIELDHRRRGRLYQVRLLRATVSPDPVDSRCGRAP